jgi:phospholipase C
VSDYFNCGPRELSSKHRNTQNAVFLFQIHGRQPGEYLLIPKRSKMDRRNAEMMRSISHTYVAAFLCTVLIALSTISSCGSGTSASTKPQPAASPTVTIAANLTSITQGSSATLTVIAANSAQVIISSSVDSNTFTLAATGGTQKVTPTATTTYTATATGTSGTATATTTITVTKPSANSPKVTITASPSTIALGSSSTLTVAASNASQVTISDNIDSQTYTLAAAGGTQVLAPTANTIYTATATGAGGTSTAQATVTVTPAGVGINSVNHIVIMMQENRSFDHYFGHLNEYRVKQGLPDGEVDDLSKAGNVSLPSWDNSGNIAPYHMITACVGDLTPSWQESHNMVNLTSPNEGAWGTPPPMNGFASMEGGYAQHNPTLGGFDVAGKRAMGYYTDADLPFYYWAATTFATSDRWFSPALTRTQPNRMYLLAATSNGFAFPGGTGDPHAVLMMTGVKSIFQLLQENSVTWKVYVTDNYVAGNLGGMDTYENYFPWAFGYADHFADASTFATDAANGTLPQVAMIEGGYTEAASDEHPMNPIDKGAQYTESLVQALMSSPSWASSVFFLTYDEGGGFYDHVPPVSMPSPDGKKPALLLLPPTDDPTGDFDTTGFRVPLMVISPFTKPGYVSHNNADFTAMLKFIETRFNLPPLTKRDAAQIDMTEFFDWSAPNLQSTNPPKQPTLPHYVNRLP